MKRPTFPLLTGIFTLILACGTASAWAQVSGQYRIDLVNGRYVEGEVQEKPDGSYEVKTKQGIIVTVKKMDVKDIRPLAKDQAAPSADPSATGSRIKPTAIRREIRDDEVEALLVGITATPDESLVGAERAEMMAPLALDEDSVNEMLKMAGGEWKKNVYVTDHFVMVYTGTQESAKKLGSRLEAVWRWNVKFMDMMNLPARRPPRKLELYYFGEWEEFDRYSRNQGHALSAGILGYYQHDNNRSHFFDLNTWPILKPYLEQLKQPGGEAKEKQRIRNRIARFVEQQNVETIQHEVGHQIHHNIGLFSRDVRKRDATVPVWIVEGTTMLFEVPPSSEGAGIGLMNHGRLFELREIYGRKPLSPDRWRQFIFDNDKWYAGGAESYCLGWSLVYYLWKEHREGYAKYLRSLFGRDDALDRTAREKEFIDCFGELDDKWFDKYYAFIDSLELKPSLCGPNEEERARAQNLARHEQKPGGKKPSGAQPQRPSGGGRGRGR